MVVPEKAARCRSFDGHRLDDDFLGVEHAVDHDPENLAADLGDDNEAVFAVAFAEPQHILEMDERQQLVAQPQYRRVLDPFDAMLAAAACAHEFEHGKLRDGETLAAGLDDQRRDDRQRERNLDRELNAGTANGLQVDRAADLLDVAAHDIHADAAAGNARHACGGGKTRREDEIADFRLRLGGDLGFAAKPVLDGLGPDARDVEAAAVVGDLDDDVTAQVAGGKADHSLRRLAHGKALGRVSMP